MALTPEEEAELAALEAELSQSESPSMQQQPVNGFWQNFTDTSNLGQEAWTAVKDTASGLGSMAEIAAKGVIQNPTWGPLGAMAPLAKTAFNTATTPGEVLQRTAGFIPGGETAVQAARDWYNDELKPSGDYGTMARKELIANAVTAPLSMVGAKTPGMLKGAYQGVRDFVAGGMPNSAIMERAASRPGIYASKLNAGQGVSNVERNLVSQIDTYDDAFTEYNPTRGLDLENIPAGKETEVYNKFKQNIKDDYVAGVTERNDILRQASEFELRAKSQAEAAGVPSEVGAKITEIPENSVTPDGLESGLDLITKTRPGGEAGVIAAKQWVEEQFGVLRETSPEQHLTGMVAAPEGRALSAVELNDVRMRLDSLIREKGAYDLSQAPPGINPSALQSEVAALKYYRGQIDNLLKQKISNTLGEDAANLFAKTGDRIGYAKTYGIGDQGLSSRFQDETNQAFTPGSANRAPPGKGIKAGESSLVSNIRSVLPMEDTHTATKALTREVDALRDLQRLVEINSTPGFTPAPRGWAQIKSSAKDIFTVENLALSLGLIGAAGDLNNMPDEMAKKVVGQVASIFPQAFVSTPDKINVIDDQYQDPFGKQVVISGAMQSSPEERAMRIGSTYTNKYVPPQVQTPIKQPPPALPATLDRLNKNLDSAFAEAPIQTPTSYDGSLQSQLEQLTRMEALNSSDIQ